jgi:7-carboxy-7-deazaguanine synthase
MRVSRLPGGDPEIFASIQGEGPTVGLPSVFVRLGLCNESCEFCDTPYTWDWRTYDPKVELVRVDVEDVARRVRELAADGIRNVVLTGGEPMLQARQLTALASMLRSDGFRIEVETNGTIRPGEELVRLVDQWNVSPKLESSGNPLARREVPAALEWFARHAHAYWKFVVLSPDDLPEIETLVERYRVPKERVILMPEGTDPETLAERSRWMADACQERGWRLGARLHVQLWGAARGR